MSGSSDGAVGKQGHPSSNEKSTSQSHHSSTSQKMHATNCKQSDFTDKLSQSSDVGTRHSKKDISMNNNNLDIKGHSKHHAQSLCLKDSSSSDLRQPICKSKDRTDAFVSPYGITVTLHVADIVKANADAVVTSEDLRMRHHSMVTEALCRIGSGGEEFRQLRSEMRYNSARREYGNVFHTSMNKHRCFPFKFVLHAMLRPYDDDYSSGWMNDLFRLYRNIFVTADELHLKSVALPFLGTGCNEADMVNAIKIAIQATVDFEPRYLENVQFVSLDNAPIILAKEWCQSCLIGCSEELQDNSDSATTTPTQTATNEHQGKETRPEHQSGHTTHANTSGNEREIETTYEVKATLQGVTGDQHPVNKQVTNGDQGDASQVHKDNLASLAVSEAVTEDSWQNECKVPDETEPVSDLQNGESDDQGGQSNWDQCHDSQDQRAVVHQCQDSDDPTENSNNRSQELQNKSQGSTVESQESAEESKESADENEEANDTRQNKCDLSESEEKDERPENIETTDKRVDEKASSVSEDVTMDEKKLEKSEHNGHDGDTFCESTKEEETCPICMDVITDVKELKKCGHKFCRECINDSFKHCKPICPSCQTVYGVITGNMPKGTMNVRTERYPSLPGYHGCGYITIDYSFPDGTQTIEHPHPGRRYRGTSRTGFLPNNKEGQLIVKLLRLAFDRRLTFTVGRSVTTGRDDVVIWNDIHHKTSMDGGATGYGYPDDTYLSRVKEELASKGVTEDQLDQK